MNRRRRLGQHYLVDQGVARAVADALPAEPARVFEIGPGKGALTRELIARFPEVLALEIDGALSATLASRLGSPSGLTVVQGDALLADLSEIAGGVKWVVAGNLPYSVATPIVRRLLKLGELFPVAVLMVQDEVARRLVAPPGDGSRGFFTLEVEAHARAELLWTVPPRSFAPPPKVVSAVVRLTASPGASDAGRERQALSLASQAFQHRRKKIGNALEAAAPRAALTSALERAGIGADRRAQDLTLEAWFDLAGALGDMTVET